MIVVPDCPECGFENVTDVTGYPVAGGEFLVEWECLDSGMPGKLLMKQREVISMSGRADELQQLYYARQRRELKRLPATGDTKTRKGKVRDGIRTE